MHISLLRLKQQAQGLPTRGIYYVFCVYTIATTLESFRTPLCESRWLSDAFACSWYSFSLLSCLTLIWKFLFRLLIFYFVGEVTVTKIYYIRKIYFQIQEKLLFKKVFLFQFLSAWTSFCKLYWISVRFFITQRSK